MRKNIFSIVFFLLAVICIVSSARVGSQNALIGGIAIALVFVFLGLKQFRTGKTEQKRTTKKKPVIAKNESTVYVAAGGNVYHNSDLCQYIYGTKTDRILKSEAKSNGLRPCKKCYPYDD